ncbi:MAG: hypothetical protein WAL85_12795, partial [Candidatus Korobacteraceae bacterium]
VVTEFGTSKWKVIAGKPSLSCVGLPTLVTDTTLVTSCKPFSYLSTTGKIVFQDTFGKTEAMEQKTAVAQSGTLVAVSLNRQKGHDFWDTGSGQQVTARSVMVYDLLKERRTFSFELKPLPKSDLDYALSPEGSKLAVLSDRHVTVCSLLK